MKKCLSLILSIIMVFSAVGIAGCFEPAYAASAPTGLWVEPTETNGIPAKIDVFVSGTNTSNSGYGNNRITTHTYTCELYLPGGVDLAGIVLSWDGDMQVTANNTAYSSGTCPIPAAGTQTEYTFSEGKTKWVYKLTTYQGSPNVQVVFIDIDESQGTIAAMDGDANHNTECVGRININGTWYDMPKIKGRGNATWSTSIDKKPYNITLGKKINFPGVESEKTKKWSFLSEVTDHSLLSNRSGFHLAYQLGIGQDTTSADVWMNGEYQGCYTVTPKTDSFVNKNGFMIEQDNYLEPSVEAGGDPQFRLDYLTSTIEGNHSSSYNRITVKKIGDNLLGTDDEGNVNETPENLTNVANNTIRPWLQKAWDAIRSDDGYCDGKYYTEYIDIESFAKMYLMHEYVKSYDVCAGSILFHREGTSDNDKLIAGPVWDLDNAMGATCSDGNLGTAIDRRNGEGEFIPIIKEYKTSIYKTISKHADFMEEVYHQYNLHRSAFEGLPGFVEQLTSEISESAKMNHYKVKDIPPGMNNYKNTHYYSRQTSLGSSPYVQNYLATTNSKADWANYAANLKTYVSTRSLWFNDIFYDPDDPANCVHEYEAVVTPPTCVEQGFTTYTCSKCGTVQIGEYTDIIAHDYHDGVCTMCGEALINVTIKCTPGASVTVYETQDLNGPCIENAALVHPRSSDSGFIDCSGDGQINFVVVLGEGFELESVEAAPKEYKNFKGPDDTGVENGYRITKVKGVFTINVSARCTHDLLTHVEASAPTCAEAGNSEYWSCKRCGKFFSDAEGTTEIAENSWIISATGHTPATAVEENRVEPTCTSEGHYDSVVYCTVCGAELSRDTVTLEALGHDYNAVVTAPTCTEQGYTTHTCSRCNESYKDAYTEALGHDWDEGVVTKAPTCTGAGVRTYTCRRCGETRTEAIEATGHTPGTAVHEHEVAATCTTSGSYDEVVYCSVCDAELTRTAHTVDALGHDLQHHEGKAATCTETGWEAYDTCKRCDYTTCVEIPATGHTPATAVEENRVEPTCTAEGHYDSVVYCSVCNAELSRDPATLEALGHDLEHHAAKAPTCTETGWVAYDTCSRCDYTTYVAIPAIGHTPGEAVHENDVAATCTTVGGYDEVVYCSVCDAELTRTARTVEALGHYWGQITWTWTADNTSATATRVCRNDPAHKQIAIANAVVSDGTDDDEGYLVYTVSVVFDGETFTDATKVIKHYSVTFDTAGGSPVSAVDVEHGSVITAPSDPTRDGYTFAGWTLNGEDYDFSKPVAGNITLVAEWEVVPSVGEASIDGVVYDTFEAAAAAAAEAGEDAVIVLQEDIEEIYTLTVGQMIRVKKGSYSLTLVAPEGYTVVESTDENDVTTYTVESLTLSLTFAHSCSFGNNLTYNFYISNAELNGFENIRLVTKKQVFNESGSEYTWANDTLYNYTAAEISGIGFNRFVFSNIAAKEMQNEIRIRLYAEKGGVTYSTEEKVYSVASYAYERLENSTSTKFKTLLVDMLNYGAAAQVYFKYNQSHPVNADLTEAQKAYGTSSLPDLNDVSNTIKVSGSTAHFYAKSIVCNSNVELKYYMTFDSGVPGDNVKLVISYTTVKGTTETVAIPSSEFVFGKVGEVDTYSVKLSTIAAKDIRCVVTAEIYDRDTMIGDISEYSIESYVKDRLQNSTNENFKLLVRELMKYGLSAENYLK